MTSGKGSSISQPIPHPVSFLAQVRRALFALHLLLGLFLGLYFVVIGITGSLLLVAPALERQQRPDLFVAQTNSPAVPLWRCIDAAQRSIDGRVKRVLPARFESDVHRVEMVGENEAQWTTYVDPSTAQVRGHLSHSLSSRLLDLHMSLMLGERGQRANGYGAWLMTLLLFSGLWLWWPGKKGFWRTAKVRLSVKRGASLRRLMHDLHNQWGVLSLPLLLMLNVTGAYFVIGDPFEPLVRRVIGPERVAAEVKIVPQGQALPTSQLLQIAQQRYPTLQISRVWLPPKATSTFRTEHLQPYTAEGMRWVEYHRLEINPYTGRILVVDEAKSLSSLERFYLWFGPMHFGAWAGIFSQILYFLGGLAPLALFWTGVWKWNAKRRGRARNRERHKTTSFG